LRRGVDEIREASGDTRVTDGVVDVGKHRRPSFRGGRVVLFVEPCREPNSWRAVKLS
jgi:hypothetical protein